MTDCSIFRRAQKDGVRAEGMFVRMFLGILMSAFSLCVFGGEDAACPPEAPRPDEWTFRRELAEQIAHHARSAYRIVDEYGLSNGLETVRGDLDDYMASAGKQAARALTLRKGEVDGYESYRVEVAANGDVTLTANDDDGIRRAAYYFEDREFAGDLKDTVRRPWLKNRISRCFFGPIKRAPFFRDELMDDIDYYPDAYLNRLAHEGINGLWLTVELRDLVRTSFNERDKDAPRRLAKLRRTVGKCARYGIRVWPFCIEPRRMEDGDPLLAKFPAAALSKAPWGAGKVLCPASPLVRQYIEEAFQDLFEQVPGLPGVLNISHGERPTTCLSSISPVDGKRGPCPQCANLEPWRIHWNTAAAVVKGMRAANPKAEFISWFYQPQVEYERAPWVAEVSRHLPEGVTMIYNFESGAVKNQLGRYRPGGDYWLSYVGPSPSFEKVAAASREANGLLGAKIQVGCSHECATVPFVPVPGLLYRKYRAMRAARCTTVMQCWYFGNYPGVMNKAAGELAFSDFSEEESEFLRSLARPDWRDSAPEVAEMWRRLSDAYADYPLSNDMQYYGPFHAGVAWPLLPEIALAPLGRTWKPQDPPSGDAIGECLENHTLEEAAVLAERMCRGALFSGTAMTNALGRLAVRFADEPERLRDLDVIRALQLLFKSGADILEFYRQRERAVAASRYEGDPDKAKYAIGEMRRLIVREQAVSDEMAELCRKDSRLGFHSEAEAHQFHADKLVWRGRCLSAALERLKAIEEEVSAGKPYPLSAHERTAPSVKEGETVNAADGVSFAVRFRANGDFEMTGSVSDARALEMGLYGVCGTSWPYKLSLTRSSCDIPSYNVVARQAVVRSYETSGAGDGWTFSLVLDARGWDDVEIRRPGWLLLTSEGRAIWPKDAHPGEYRLNLDQFAPSQFGRIGAVRKFNGEM